MKTTIFSSALLIVMAVGIGSCTKSSTMPSTGNSAGNTVTFQATLTGASETPPNASMATGSATFTYDLTTYILTGTVNFQGITPTASHIHKGAVGVAGGVVLPLATTAPITSPISFTSAPLDSTQRADLLSNMYYVNVHSVTYPLGEIRGQLILQTSTTGGGMGGY